MAVFKAIVIEKVDSGTKAALTDFDEANLMDGDVTVRVEYSTVNYKDGLAITGKAPVVRRFPMIAGVDFAGTVESSNHAAWKAGDKVVLNGWGCGETHLGAYAEKARVNGDWLVPLPKTMSYSRCDGDRHSRVHRNVGCDGPRTTRASSSKWRGGGERGRRRRRFGRRRHPRRSRIHRARDHRPPAGS